MTRRTLLLLSAAMLAGLCAGCQGRFTRQNYETICVGQQAQEVRAVLGPPNTTTTAGSLWMYEHHRPFYRAVIRFQDGRVAAKKWFIERPADDGGDRAASKPG